MAGIYIHIPFCKSRCIYCGFYSTTNLNIRQQYVNALCKEMALRKNYIDESVSTIYIGGGTPSLLTEGELKTIFEHIYNLFVINDDNEITIECNPDDITNNFANILRELPVNRVSMGAQTFNNARLKFLQRRHNAEEIKQAVQTLRKENIKNISLDLMFGFPDETLEEWLEDINQAISLDVEHISAYSLMYEEGTPLTAMLKSNKIKDIDEELSLDMYESLVSRMKSVGYEHYEISNFARPGFRSRHNSSYWLQVPYIGIGAAAHSFDIKSRQYNVSDINRYISQINNGIIPMERELLNNDTIFNDIITTTLRTNEGIDLQRLSSKLGKSYANHLTHNAANYISEGLMEIYNHHIRLTYKGILISDTIMSYLMIV